MPWLMSVINQSCLNKTIVFLFVVVLAIFGVSYASAQAAAVGGGIVFSGCPFTRPILVNALREFHQI